MGSTEGQTGIVSFAAPEGTSGLEIGSVGVSGTEMIVGSAAGSGVGAGVSEGATIAPSVVDVSSIGLSLKSKVYKVHKVLVASITLLSLCFGFSDVGGKYILKRIN